MSMAKEKQAARLRDERTAKRWQQLVHGPRLFIAGMSGRL